MDIEPPDDIEIELVEGTDGLDAESGLAPDGRLSGDMFSFVGELFHWRGPSPYHFVTVPPDVARAIRAVAAEVTYGWGMIPAEVRIGSSVWTTALWPKDGGYVVPIKDRYRKAERLELGASVSIQLAIRR
jgi:hypothetical protein